MLPAIAAGPKVLTEAWTKMFAKQKTAPERADGSQYCGAKIV